MRGAQGVGTVKSTGGVVREILGYRWAFKGSEWNKYSLPGCTFLSKLCTAGEKLGAWAFGRLWNPEKMEGAVARKERKLTFPETSELEL